jgi:predicted GH43/DUF377 family glycosyl hydrolase
VTQPELVSRCEARLRPDPARVVARLFVAGQEVVGGGEPRASGVVRRVLAVDEATAKRRLSELLDTFGHRHRDILATYRHHAERVEYLLDPEAQLSDERLLLLGAAFTHEYSIEAAALCNPSIVADPDQSTAPVGGLRFVMSARGIGEGHISSVGFRNGTVTADGLVTVDEPGPFPIAGASEAGMLERHAFHGRLQTLGTDGESAAFVLDHFERTFTSEELEARLTQLMDQTDTRAGAAVAASQIREVAACSYVVRFSTDTELSERVLWPASAAESSGLEDARFVRFVEDDGTVAYYATYTAFDGVGVSQQLLRTTDFLDFASSPVAGPAATNKGLALFPRRIGGRFAALSRHDGENNAVAFSQNLTRWSSAVTCQKPELDWEIIQLGNCGSPMETDAGWLVLTHGVGPMRTYSIGAMLLDLDEPAKVLATLPTPLLTPHEDERDGYVPNVVYSCGALLHGDMLVIPFGIADTAIGIATASCSEVLEAMVRVA